MNKNEKKLKKFKIFLKKGLTNGFKSGIIYKLSASGLRRSLKIEQQTKKYKHTKKCEETVKEFEKHELKGKSV